MVARIRLLFLSSLLVVGLSSPTTADPTLPANAEALVAEGIKAYDAEDYQRAKEILLPLAEAGHPEAMHRIGRLYDGKGVFPHDPKTECDWYEKAANKGLAKSMYNMSICYDGNGRPDDPEQDKAWLLKAASHGYIRAMINLSALDKNHGLEYRTWMNRAKEHGSIYAKVSLWIRGYKEDVPDLSLDEKACVIWNILLLDESIHYCD